MGLDEKEKCVHQLVGVGRQPGQPIRPLRVRRCSGREQAKADEGSHGTGGKVIRSTAREGMLHGLGYYSGHVFQILCGGGRGGGVAEEKPVEENGMSSKDVQRERTARSIEASEAADRPGLWPRSLGALICAGLLVIVVAQYRGWKTNRDRLVELATSSGALESDSEAFRRVARETVPNHARIAVARALIYDVFENSSTLGEEQLTHLSAAEELVRQVIPKQPISWQSYMLLGSSIYLDRTVRRDPALFTDYRDWEAPLLKAVEETAGQIEPRRILAWAYLQTWHSLSPQKKDFAKQLLREVFAQSPSGFRRLIGMWLEQAENAEEAFALMPPQPSSWRYLEQLYAQAGDWTTYSVVHSRYLDVLEKKLRADFVEAKERLRLGDPGGSRAACLKIITQAPPSQRFAPLVIDALKLFPPGLRGQASSKQLNAWLQWALDLDTIGLRPFPPDVLNRLTDAMGDLPPRWRPTRPCGDDLYHVRQFEKLYEPASRSEWASFSMARARWLIRHEPQTSSQEVARLLARIPEAAKSQIPYWQAKYGLAEITGDRASLVEAERELEAFRASKWNALDWEEQGREAALRMWPSVAAAGVVLEILPDREAGAVVEVIWDGHLVAVQPVQKGRLIHLVFPRRSEPPLLQVRALEKTRMTPSRVRLRDPRPPTGDPSVAAEDASLVSDAP